VIIIPKGKWTFLDLSGQVRNWFRGAGGTKDVSDELVITGSVVGNMATSTDTPITPDVINSDMTYPCAVDRNTINTATFQAHVAGNATINVGASGASYKVYSIVYTEAGAATPAITPQDNTTSEAYAATKTVTASVTTEILAGPFVVPGGTVIKLNNGAAGDTWSMSYEKIASA
jgi:hypothetical protein